MKLNAQALESHWQEIIGKLHEKWGSLNEQDLQQVRGDIQKFVRTIQQKTGEMREAVQKFLDETASAYGGTVQQAAETIREYANRAAESVQEVTGQASESVRSSVQQTQKIVRTHPMESLLTCFGVGILAGVVLGIMNRSK